MNFGLDQETLDQAGVVIQEISGRLDILATRLDTRDLDIHSLPSAMFVAFVTVALMVGKNRGDIGRWIPAGFKVIDETLTRRGENVSRYYGRGRRCAMVSREVIQTVLEGAKKEVDEAALLIHRPLARETLCYKHLLEFCATFRLLDPHPDSAREMMAAAGGLCEEVIASGWLDRNVIHLR